MIANPKGIDRPIQEMQQLFINNLWTSITDKQYYHRVFRNENKSGNLTPQVFIDNTNDYRDVIFNDSLSALSWFDVAPETTSADAEQYTQGVGVFFAVNLKKLYPTLSHRAVEESHAEVRRILMLRASEFKIEGISTGEAAYGDFQSVLNGLDMQPWHVFRFNCNVSFTLNC
jgi:hypothetical protein